MTLRPTCLAVALVTFGLTGGYASAAENTPVVLLLPHGDPAADRFAGRLFAELSSVGFSVVTQTSAPPDIALERRAEDAGATAVVRTLPSQLGVELWIHEHSTGRPMVRQMVLDERPGGPDVAMVVLQATELLRAAVFSPRAEAPAAPPEKTSSNLTLAPKVGPGAWFSPGGLGGLAAALTQLSLVLRSRWTLDVWCALPLSHATLTSWAGSAEVRTVLAGVGPGRRFAWGPRWTFSLGAGAAALWLGTRGHAAPPPLESSRDSATVGAAYTRAAISFAPLSWLRLGLDALAAGTLTRTEVSVAGRPAVVVGRPLVGTFLTVESLWP